MNGVGLMSEEAPELLGSYKTPRVRIGKRRRADADTSGGGSENRQAARGSLVTQEEAQGEPGP
jgi:hypothetical protein